VIQLFLGLLGTLTIAGLSDVVPLGTPRPVAWCAVLAAAAAAFSGSKAISRALAARPATAEWPLRWAGVAVHLGAYAAVLYPLGWARWALLDLRWSGEGFVSLVLLVAPAAGIALWLAPWAYIFERRASRTAARRSFARWLVEKSRPVLAVALGFLAVAWAADRLESIPPVGEAMALHPSLDVALASAGLLALFAASPYLLLLAWPSTAFAPEAAWERLSRLAGGSPLRREAVRIWDDRTASVLNACVVGLVPSTRRIFFTRGMLDLLEPGDLAAVLAHEQGHIRKGHMGIHVLAAISFILSLAAVDAASASLPEWLSGSVFIAYAAAYWLFFFGPASRWLEIEADLAGAGAVGTEPYVGALARVGDYLGPAARKGGWRHFSIERRIEILLRSVGDAAARAVVFRRIRAFRGAILAVAALSAGAFVATAALDLRRPGEEMALASARIALGEAEDLRALLAGAPPAPGGEPGALERLLARTSGDIETAYRSRLERALHHLRAIGPGATQAARNLLEEAKRARH
jgi:Zn-dependent protease with chaperone function